MAPRLFSPFVYLMLISCIYSSCNQIEEAAKTASKHNPGHYVAVGPYFDIEKIKHLSRPELKGINKRYFWRTLEPIRDSFDFSQVDQDLKDCIKHNKQLIIFLCDRSFWIKGALPEYLKKHEWTADGKGYIPIRWAPEFLERFINLGKALSERYDHHPNFEGIAIQETSLGLPNDILIQYQYTSEKYQQALMATLLSLSTNFSKSNVFWYQNGIEGNNLIIRKIADSIAHKKNIVMGGPDILPYRRWLRHTYKIYHDYKDRIPLFCSAQDDSYHHHKNDVSASEKNSLHEEGYLSMEEIFKYARDEMHIKYLFWNYYYEGIDNGERSFDDAVDVIIKYPTFNP